MQLGLMPIKSAVLSEILVKFLQEFAGGKMFCMFRHVCCIDHNPTIMIIGNRHHD